MRIEQALNFSGQKFYKLIDDVSQVLHQINHRYRQAFDNAAGIDMDAISRLDKEADYARHKLLLELAKSFITPFDRDDLHSLTVALIGVCKYQYATIRALQRFHLLCDEYLLRVAHANADIIARILQLVDALRNKNKLSSLAHDCKEVKDMIAHCDTIWESAYGKLYAKESELVADMKIAEVYNAMEILSGKCADVLNVLESVVIKYG